MIDRGTKAATRIRLIATDLDGTLLRDDQTVSERTRQTLAQVAEAGVALVLVTGRPPRFVRKLANELNLPGIAICCNGAIMYDVASGALLEHTPLASVDALAVVEGLRSEAPGITFAVEQGLAYGCEPAYIALGSRSYTPDDLLADALVLCGQPVTKLIARHPRHAAEELHPLALRIAGERATVTYSSATFVEMSASGIDKAATLARLCERMNIMQHEVIAFGDMLNDIPMLRWAGRGIAMANAHAATLAAADEVTTSNVDDGVALALEQLLDL